jgi:hypothetical protein
MGEFQIRDHARPACFLIIRDWTWQAPGRSLIREVNGKLGDRSPLRANHLGGQLLEQII